MLSRSLRFGLACECIAWCSFGWFVLGLSVAQTFIFFVTGMLVVRVVLTLAITGVSRLFARKSLRLGWRWLIVIGYEIVVRLYCWLFVFPWQFTRANDEVRPTAAKELKPATVLLVHGFFCNRTVWYWMQRRLAKAGWPTALLDLEPVHGDIDVMVEQLAARINALSPEPVILVCHSMGGLVARACLQRFGPGRVEAIYTLCTPHQGTLLARCARLSMSVRQMVPGNPWLVALGRGELPVPLVSIYSEADDIVVPAENAVLPGSRSVVAPPAGHMAMLFSPKVVEILLTELDRSK